MKGYFSVVVRVRYSECDAQGVVFNARYGDYTNLACIEYFRELLGGYSTLTVRGIDIQTVNLTTNWTSSARYDDIIRINVETIKVGNSSYSLRLYFHDYKTGRPIAITDTTCVMVDSESYSKIAVPGDIRETLLLGAKGVCVDELGRPVSTI